MAKSLDECQREIAYWTEKLNESQKQLKWWTDELQAAIREEKDNRSRDQK